MKARKRTGLIEVEQYRQGQPLPDRLHDLILIGDDGATVFNKPQGVHVPVHDGDYVRVDNPEDIYPINAAYFAENYDPVEG
jgi:hypothetical protein